MRPVSVLKLGGAVDRTPSFWLQVRKLSQRRNVLIVHGGGAQSTELAHQLGHIPTFVHGRRITGDLDLNIARWVMRGAVNTDLVCEALTHGLLPIGVSGADGSILRVTRRPPWSVDGKEVDFGWVGDIEQVHTELLTVLVAHDYIPIVASLGVDAEGQIYNVNADTVAGAIAEALEAHELLLVTPTGGLRREAEDPATLVPEYIVGDRISSHDEQWITDGMRVKVGVAARAVASGIRTVLILGPDDLIDRARVTRVTS